jgi:hypothetical protein
MTDVKFKTASRSTQPTAETKLVKNPFYGYSSYTYNFTLAAVRKTDANTPDTYMDTELDLVILKTGGKGFTGLSTKVEVVDRIVTQRINTETGDTYTPVNSIEKDFSGSELVKSFNQKSPGRFDMFIDNVEIDTVMGPNEASGATTATSIKFEVIEPYSVNGFIEALHVAAVAAGYLTYTHASYVLKMEFKGYPSTAPLAPSEVIPLSTRYFLLGFTGVDVEITERGTLYRCKAVSFNEKALGLPNTIKSPVSMNGTTIEKILGDLCNNLNELASDDDKSSKAENKLASTSDRYFIKFPTRNKDGSFNYKEVNSIGKSNLVSIDKSNRLFSFRDPGDASQGVKNAYKIVGEKVQGKESPETTDSQVQYREGAKIHEIISSVVRDSEYIKKKLKDLKPHLDNYGYFEYFIIKVEVTNRSVIDTVSRKPFQDFTYSVVPYLTHFTRIPGYHSQKIDVSNFKNIVLKEYNYIYTGGNNDILNFKLNFNTLYFEAIPKALGDNDLPTSRFSSEEREKDDRKIVGDNQETLKKETVGTPMFRTSDAPTSVQQSGGNAGQPSDDPYLALARNMHDAIINSQTSMVSGELEIIGDPFYLIQGGIGSYNPKTSKDSDKMNELGDVNHLLGEVLIQIKFNNPVGIQSLEEGGLYAFSDEKVPFSGIYRVNTARSTFSDGIFKQRLQVVRMSGQIIDNSPATDPNLKYETETLREGVVTQPIRQVVIQSTPLPPLEVSFLEPEFPD